MVIARALLLKPKFLICDEPTSALDASIRAQILNLLVELKEQLDLTLVLISHDLRVVRYLCDRVAVMYLGEIVEVAPRDELFTNPRHPYTRVLLAATLTEESTADDMVLQLKGEPPSPIDIRRGLPVPPPLSDGPGRLQRQGPGRQRDRPGPHRELPLLGRGGPPPPSTATLLPTSAPHPAKGNLR